MVDARGDVGVPSVEMLIRGGTIITGGPNRHVITSGDVWLRDDVIDRIEPAGASVPSPGCTIIEARGFIVMPGLIDSHRHLWQTLLRGIAADMTAPQYRSSLRAIFGEHFTPDDVFVATLSGALDALDSGITTLLDWSHITNSPDHSDASVAALRSSGMRCVYAHGGPNDHEVDAWWSNSSRPHQQDAVRVRNQLLSSDDGLVTMMLGVRAPQLVTPEVMVHDWHLARKLGLRLTIDGGLGGGLWGKRHYPIRLLSEANLMGPDATYVHCNNLAKDEYELISRTGGSVSISPCAEMYVGHGKPATPRLLAVGVKPSLSIDSAIFASGDLFGEMRATLGVERGTQSQAAFERGEGVASWNLTTSDVFEFATSAGAAALGLSHRTGLLAPGYQADIVLINTKSVRLAPTSDPVSTVVLQATPADVDTVIVAGTLKKRGGKLLRDDIGAIVDTATAARDRIFARVGIGLGDGVAVRDTAQFQW